MSQNNQEAETRMDIERPRAVGCVVGRLKRFEDGTATLELENGEKYRCKLRGWKAKKACTSQDIQMYCVYPSRRAGELVLKITGVIKRTEGRKNGHFVVCGKIEKIREDRVVLSVWSVQRQRNYWTDVQGKLDCQPNEYWKIEARLEGQELKVVEAERLAEVFRKEDLVEAMAEPTITIVEEVVQGVGSGRTGAV